MTTTRFIAIGYFCHELLDKYDHPSYALAPLQFVMTYSRHSQFYIATVVSINRMTAVMFPSRYEDVRTFFLSRHSIIELYSSDLGTPLPANRGICIHIAYPHNVVPLAHTGFACALPDGRIDIDLCEAAAQPVELCHLSDHGRRLVLWHCHIRFLHDNLLQIVEV